MDAQQRQQRRQAVTAYSQKYGKEEFIRAVLNIYDRALLKYNTLQKKKK